MSEKSRNDSEHRAIKMTSQSNEAVLWLLAHFTVPKPWLGSCAGQHLLPICWDPGGERRAAYWKGLQIWKEMIDFWGKILSSFQNCIWKSVEEGLASMKKLCVSRIGHRQWLKLTERWAETALCSWGVFWSAWPFLVKPKICTTHVLRGYTNSSQVDIDFQANQS